MKVQGVQKIFCIFDIFIWNTNFFYGRYLTIEEFQMVIKLIDTRW